MSLQWQIKKDPDLHSNKSWQLGQVTRWCLFIFRRDSEMLLVVLL